MSEPWKLRPPLASQICGYRDDSGPLSDQYCGKRKAPGRYYRLAHHREIMNGYGVVEAPSGTAVGEGSYDSLPPHGRDVPHHSGEAAIYSIEYLPKREGTANGTTPDWRDVVSHI